MDDIKFFNADDFSTSLRCTIQKTGKLGFTDFTQKQLSMDEGTYIRIGERNVSENEKQLFLQICDPTDKVGGFKISKAGRYYYLNTKVLFDELGYDYKKKPIIFELVKYDGEKKIYKMIRRNLTSKEVL